jgi:hypothetical protein
MTCDPAWIEEARAYFAYFDDATFERCMNAAGWTELRVE